MDVLDTSAGAAARPPREPSAVDETIDADARACNAIDANQMPQCRGSFAAGIARLF